MTNHHILHLFIAFEGYKCLLTVPGIRQCYVSRLVVVVVVVVVDNVCILLSSSSLSSLSSLSLCLTCEGQWSAAYGMSV